MLKHIKGDSWEFLGVTLTTQYINAITLPALLQTVQSASHILEQLESVKFPWRGQPKLLLAKQYRDERIEAERNDAIRQKERWAAMNPDKEQLRQREANKATRARNAKQMLKSVNNTAINPYNTNQSILAEW